MADPEGLTPKEQMAHAARLMDRALGRSSASQHPHAVLTGGQPGSGKSYIVKSVGVKFQGVGGAVVIDPDEIRPTLPYMKARIESGDLEIPNVANVDAGTIAYQMIQIAKAERRNIIIDGTLQNTARAVDLADELRKADYDVEFHGMAVHPGLSHARTYKRREEQIEESPTGFGRGVSDEFHDQAVKGYGLTIETFQKKASVNSMTFHYGATNKTVTTNLVDGNWVPAVSMKDELDKVQQVATPEVAQETAETWTEAAAKMLARKAEQAEIAKIETFRQRAAAAVLATMQVNSGQRPTAPAAATIARDEPERSSSDGNEETALKLATLVHAGIRQAGRNANDSLMSVNWTPEETILEIKVPAERGYERFTLPEHAAVEQALGKEGRQGVVEVDFAQAPARVRDATPAMLAGYASDLGVTGEAMGIRDTTREEAPGRSAGMDETTRRAISARMAHGEGMG